MKKTKENFMKKEKQVQSPRKWWFRLLKKLMKVRYKEPEFRYLGEEISTGGVILSNHEGTDAPMSFEIYSGKPVRFWGTHEMNSGLVKMYKYQSRVYFHEKKHWSLFGARMFCLIASPLTNLFYKGLNLISTYPDARFKKTIKESFEAIQNGENIVIFPEKSPDGYKATMDEFFGGFVVFCEYCAKKGIDIPIYTSYLNKEKRVYIVDKPIKYSEIKAKYKTREDITSALCQRTNELGAMTIKEEINEELQELEILQN